jgi:hypothetical protein
VQAREGLRDEIRPVRSPIPLLVAALFACGGADPTPTTPPPTTPGPTSTPPPNVSVTVQRVDADAECNGLLPDRVPSPVAISRTTTPGSAAPDQTLCGGGISDGTGHVAVVAGAGDGARWQVFASDGSPRQALTAWPLFAEASGWQGLRVTPVPAPDQGSVIAQVTFQPDGSPSRSNPVSLDPALVITERSSLAADPLGGSFALLADIDAAHNHWSSLRAQRFDASGAPRWPGPIRLGSRSDPVLFLAAGVSRAGEALALWQHSAFLDLAWLDAAGATVTSAELAERAADVIGTAALSPALELVPLLDGSVAVRAEGSFRRVYPRLATASAPLPAWLAGRASWSLRFTRGNRGYALFPPAGQVAPDCGQTIELRALSGRLCGQVVLRAEQSGSCVTGAVDQGWDGTVIQQVTKDACSWRFWPGLLGG